MRHEFADQFERTVYRGSFELDKARQSENPLFSLNQPKSILLYPEALAIAGLVGAAWIFAAYAFFAH